VDDLDRLKAGDNEGVNNITKRVSEFKSRGLRPNSTARASAICRPGGGPPAESAFETSGGTVAAMLV